MSAVPAIQKLRCKRIPSLVPAWILQGGSVSHIKIKEKRSGISIATGRKLSSSKWHGSVFPPSWGAGSWKQGSSCCIWHKTSSGPWPSLSCSAHHLALMFTKSLCVRVFSSPSGAYIKFREILSQFSCWLVFFKYILLEVTGKFENFVQNLRILYSMFDHAHLLFPNSLRSPSLLFSPTLCSLPPPRAGFITPVVRCALHWKHSQLTRGYISSQRNLPFHLPLLKITNGALAGAQT